MNIKDNNPQINKSNIDKDGNLQEWMDATPVGMTCEFGKCRESEGKDYERVDSEKEGDGWDSAPIYLCDEHSKDRNPLTV